MNRRKSLFAVGAVLAAIIVGTGIAIAAGGDDQPLTGNDLDRAVAAALEHTGGGTVTETEIGDDGAAYSVEIRREDGSQVEVQLDAQFNVVGDEADDDGPLDVDDGAGDD
ncbi:MAG: PepSY domain-containing protein [Acidimicrobiia bacterium]